MSALNIALNLIANDLTGGAFGNVVGRVGLLSEMVAALGQTMGDTSITFGQALAAALGAGAAFLVFGGATMEAVSAGGDLQSAMVDVQLSVRGASDVLPQMTSLIIDLADHSVYSSQQIADAFFALGKHLIDAQDILNGVGQAAITMGVAMGSDASPAADLLGQAMQVFGFKATDASRVADMLTNAFYNGIPSTDSLKQAIANAGGVAASMGVKFDDFLAVMDMIAPRMGSASMAATGLRYVLTTLADPTAKQAKEMKALGLATLDAAGKINTSQFYDAKGNFIGLAASISKINDAIKNMNPQDKAKALGELFNVRSGTAIRTLLGFFSDFQGAYQQYIKAIDSPKSAETDAQKRLDTLNASTKEFQTTLTDAWARIGITILPAITGVLKNFNALVDGFNKASPAVHQAVGVFLLAGTVLGGVLAAGIAIAVILMSPFAAIIGIVAAAFAAVVVVAAAVAGAFFLISTHLKQLQAFLAPVGKQFSSTFQAVVKDLTPLFKQIGSMLGDSMKQIGQAFSQLGAAVKPLAPVFIFLAKVIGGIVVVALGVALGVIVGLISGLAVVLAGVVRFATGIIQVFVGLVQLVTAPWKLLFALITAVVHGQFGQIPGILQKYGMDMLAAITNIGKGILNAVMGAFTALLGGPIAAIIGFVSTVIRWFQNLWSTLVGHSIIPDMIRGIVSWFARLPGMVMGIIAGFVGSVIGRIASMSGQAIAGVAGMVSGMIGRLAALPGQAAAWAGHMVSSFVSGILAGIGAAVAAASRLAGAVASILHHTTPDEGPLAGDDQWGHHLVGNLVTGMLSGEGNVRAAATRIAGVIQGSMTPAMAHQGSLSAQAAAGGQPLRFEVPIQIDGKQVAKVTLDYVNGQLKQSGMSRSFR